jgi:PAS domain S-box-containing protein
MKKNSVINSPDPGKLLTTAYILALSLLGLLSCAAYLFLTTVITEEKFNSSSIIATARQRRLSQSVALQCLALAVYKNDQQHKRDELAKSVIEMQRGHLAITKGTGEFGLPRQLSPGRHSIYFDAPLNLDKDVNIYLEHASRILKTPSSEITVDNPDVQRIVEIASGPLIRKLDLLVEQCARDCETKINQIQSREGVVLGLTLAVLLTEAFLVFFPMSRRIQTQMAALVEQTNLLHLAKDAIIVRDLNGKILFWNRGAEAMYGYSSEEALGKISHELLKTKFPAPLKEIDSVVYEQRYWAGELIHTTKNNEIIPVASRWALNANNKDRQNSVMELNTDVSLEKQAEHVKSEFYSIITHELRAPLTSIRGSFSLLKAGRLGDLPDRAKQVVAVGMGEADRMLKLVNEFLDVKKLESGRLDLHVVTVIPDEVIERTLAAVANFADQYDIGLNSKIIDNDPIAADPDRLVQILTNLISNAIKFSNAGQTVTIETQKINNKIRFSIIDTGAGIDHSNIDKLFRMFEQVHSTSGKGGTGIGLAVCKSLVEQHGGKIGINSEIGKGSTFWFEIPCA